MAQTMPHSELVRRALFFIDEARRERPGAQLDSLLDEAGARFNLSPRDAEVLQAIFEDADKLGGK